MSGCSESIFGAEVLLHGTEDDCYMAIYDKVYDFTEYSKIHPAAPGRAFLPTILVVSLSLSHLSICLVSRAKPHLGTF